jgi:hypothetical protein
MKIFLDTSAVIAYYNADDRFHAEASRNGGSRIWQDPPHEVLSL